MRKYFIGFILIPFLSFSQKDPAVLIDKYMQEYVRSKDFSGVVLVAQKDKVIYKKAFGFANKEWNIPNTIETKFRIGSNTKQMTAAAILQLIEKGRLSLDDRLSKFFPDFLKADSVTIRMLLNHTSGIRNFGATRNFSIIRALPYSRDSVVALIKNGPYEFSPGTRWGYNNSAFFLLGYIIEKITGQSYSAYMNEFIFSKAGMRNSGVNNLDSIMKYRAAGYERTRTGWKNAAYVSMEFPFSAGAIYSIVEDMYRWNKALYGGKIISEKSLEQMTTPTVNHYGFGLRIDSFYNHKRIGHNGSIPGFEAQNVWFPQEELCIVLLSNNEADVIGMAEDIEAILFQIPKVVMDAAMLDAFAGNFRSSDNSIRFRFARNGNTMRFIGAGEEIDLYPTSPNTFVNGYARRQFLTFLKGPDGKIKLQYIRNGVMTELEKID